MMTKDFLSYISSTIQHPNNQGQEFRSVKCAKTAEIRLILLYEVAKEELIC